VQNSTGAVAKLVSDSSELAKRRPRAVREREGEYVPFLQRATFFERISLQKTSGMGILGLFVGAVFLSVAYKLFVAWLPLPLRGDRFA
jgi:hypothetical protein